MDIIATAPQASVSSARPGGPSKPEANQGEFDALLDSQAKDDGAIAPEAPARADTPSKDDDAAEHAPAIAPDEHAKSDTPSEEADTDGSEIETAPAAPVTPAPATETVAVTPPTGTDAKTAASVTDAGAAASSKAALAANTAPASAHNGANAAGAAATGAVNADAAANGVSPELAAQADKALNTPAKSNGAAAAAGQTGAAKAAASSAAAGANANTNNNSAAGNQNGGASNAAGNSAASANASAVAKAAASPAATPLAAAPAIDAPSADAAAQAGDGAEAVAELRQLTSGASAPHANAAGAARDAAVVRWDPSAIAAFAARFARRAADGATRFELRMDPPELGRVDVKLDIDAEGRARAQLTVERPETLAEMTRHARQLERALNEAGVELGEDGVQFQLAADAGGDMRDETFAANDDAASASRAAANDAHAETAPRPPVEFDAGGYSVLSRARLDIRA